VATFGSKRETSPVPVRALVLSLLALAVPVVGSVFASDWISQDTGILIWLTALVPAFLLTYYRGWRGASVALAAGMATLSITNALALGLGLPIPETQVVLLAIGAFIAMSLGIGILAEVMRRERSAAEAMALTDALTQLPNRRHASIFLPAALGAGARGESVTLVLMDLDHFKQVNDRFGHRVGDQVLKGFARALRKAARRSDLTARWGGEEFLSILADCDPSGAESFLLRLRAALAEESFPCGPVTFSAGVAPYLAGYDAPELWVEAADQALYQAKEAGRDTHRIVESMAALQALLGTAAEPHEPGEAGGLEGAGLLFGATGLEAPLLSKEGHPLPGGVERILVVEGDAGDRATLVAFLRQLGYQVESAAEGGEALRLAAETGGFDLVVTPRVLPGLGGFALVRKLQESVGPIRVLYRGGAGRQRSEWASAPGGVQGYLLRPLGAEELASAVRRALETPLPTPVASTPELEDTGDREALLERDLARELEPEVP